MEGLLDRNLLDAIKTKRAIPVFGSGALFGAKFPNGRRLLLGDDLRDALCEKFLGEEFNGESLQYVAELVETKTSLFHLQEFVASQFEGVEPADFHLDITKFNWRAIFTTNYDTLIEDAYNKSRRPLQRCRSVISNNDPLDEIRKTDDQVPLYKLHGCVTRPRDPNIPFILTVEQYVDYLEHRDRLFKELYELAFENTLIFVGHSLKDSDIRAVIRQVDRSVGAGRPRYYLLKPKVTRTEIEHWAAKRISALDCTLEAFMGSLTSQMPETTRVLSFVGTPNEHPIELKVSGNRNLRDGLREFLTNNVQYIHESLLNDNGTPDQFYKGFSQGWYPIVEGLDAPRTLARKVMADAIALAENDRENAADLYIIKGEAGSGKSVLMRRLAWEVGVNQERACFLISSIANLDIDRFEEIYGLLKERLYIFIDNAANCVSVIKSLVSISQVRGIPITVITAERYTEWNEKCDELEEFVSKKFKLPYLGPDEIEELVLRLEKYGCLGEELSGLSHQQRVDRFKGAFGRQLLVALHEVTMGKNFEDIIEDEYKSLSSETARAIYRSISILNRHRVPVRAGLIHRVFGIDWSQFSEKFYKPLEKVVIPAGAQNRDLHYMARHPEIAEIVFQRAYKNVQDRYHEYVRVLRCLNISYQSDRISFRSMIKAKTLDALFPSFEDVNRIYNLLLEDVGRDPYVLQQMANYERIRDNGNLRKAIQLLQEAHALSPRDGSVLHTLATVYRDLAGFEASAPRREQQRAEAAAVLRDIVKMEGHSRYVDSSFVDLAIAGVRDALRDDETPERIVDQVIRQAERRIAGCKARFPSDSRLSSQESEFASLLSDKPRAIRALEKAYEQDSSDPFVATRLASVYESRGDRELSERTLRAALEARRTDHRINFAYAELLRRGGGDRTAELAHYYRRAFTPGDRNYEAQFWFARFALVCDDIEQVEEAKTTFSMLRKANVPHDVRNSVRDTYGGATPSLQRAKLVSRRGTYGLVEVPRFSIPALLHEEDFENGLWDIIEVGMDFECSIGFAYSGLRCCDVRLL